MKKGMSSGGTSSFKLITPSRLKITRGGGCLSIFGLPFLVGGIFVMLIGLQVIKVTNASEMPLWAWPVIMLMGLAFTCVGGVLVFGRTWTTIDTAAGTISEIKGLIVPVKRKDFSTAEFDKISLTYIPGDSDTADTYEVNLKRPAGGDFNISNSMRYSESYENAVFLADFMKLTLEDASTENKTVLKPGGLDITLKERLSRHDAAVRNAYPPAGMLSRITDDAGVLRIEIPSRGFGIANIIPLAIMAGIAWYFFEGFIPFFKRTNTPEPVSMFFTAFVVIFLILLPLVSFIKSVVRSMRNSAVLQITPMGMELSYIDAWNRKSVHIPFADIIDMDYSSASNMKISLKTPAAKRSWEMNRDYAETLSPGTRMYRFIEFMSRFARSKGIIIKTKKDVYTFAAGLPDDEVLYLFSIIKGRLKG